jgi:hypothetical protein
MIQAEKLLLSACGWWRYIKFVFHIFNQVMHFNVAWLYAVRRGKWTDHPTTFNSWLIKPHIGGMPCAVRGHVCMHAGICMCMFMYAHLVPALYWDPTSLRADNCTYNNNSNITRHDKVLLKFALEYVIRKNWNWMEHISSWSMLEMLIHILGETKFSKEKQRRLC